VAVVVLAGGGAVRPVPSALCGKASLRSPATRRVSPDAPSSGGLP